MFYISVLLAVSALAGLLGGVTGTGGILIPPVLIELFGASAHTAMGTAQASFIIPAGFAAVMFLRRGQLDKRVALPLALSGSVCTFVSAQFVKPHLDGAVLTLYLALCIVAAGIFMFKPVAATESVRIPARWQTLFLIVLGGSVGFVSGITGSGSSALLVPAMVACGWNILIVLASCQAFAVLSAGFGTIGNLLNDAVEFWEVIWLVVGQVFGIWLGVSIAQRLNTNLLRKVVASVCLAAGLFVLVKSVALLSHA